MEWKEYLIITRNYLLLISLGDAEKGVQNKGNFSFRIDESGTIIYKRFKIFSQNLNIRRDLGDEFL